jgi:probable phosphoglycerate mutase
VITEVLLIRHGETLWNQQGRMQGQNDSPLTPLGLEQARQLGRRLKNVSFAALYSSDLGRAHQTARCIADETGHEIVADPGLRERSFGIFEGLTRLEIEKAHPDENAKFITRHPDYAMPGGESTAAFSVRAVACLESIARRHRGETIVVVSHGLVLDVLYRAASGMALDCARGFPLLNCSINTFEHGVEGWRAVKVCDVDHLGPSEITRYQPALAR